MVLDLVVKRTDDGVTAEVPSLRGCESWAHDEDTAINKTLEMAAFYLKTDVKKLKIDKARANKSTTIYKILY